MEILDEFDCEVPQSETFCQQISEEDLERQADTTLSARCAASSTASTATRRWRRGWCNWNSVGSSFLRAKCAGGAEPLQQHGRPGDARAGGAAEAEHTPRAPLLPGHQEEEKEAKTEETRTHPLTGPVDLPMPATDPTATSATATTMVSVVTPSPPVYTMPRVLGPFPPLPCKSVSGSLPHSRQSWVPPAQNNPRGSPGPVAVALSPLLLSSRPLFADKVLMDKADKRGLPWLRRWVRLKAPRGSTFLTLGKQGSPRRTRQDPGAPKGQVENQRAPPTSPAPVLPLPVGMAPHAILCLQCTGLEPGWCLAPGRCRGMLTRGSQGNGAWACCFQPHRRNRSLQG
ncbi:uncharacterized protein LOC103888238 [Papio anubis]|uniref:uncharacterized protein LOC103888238 n=1 Tax=Papio anubis TaxID=9555 RepID=UPI0012AE3495|nr:uncharacterized protein LOC103888238 [Papio anubis]